MEYFVKVNRNEIEEEDEVSSNKENDETDELVAEPKLIELPLLWITVFSKFAVTSIISFSILYLILEVNEVANYNVINNYNEINNYIEFFYLMVSFLLIIFHLRRFRWNRNCFKPIEFDNFPMLFVMVICAFINIGYYFINFVSISTENTDISRILSTLSELLFVTVLFPFVIICVCNKLRKNRISLRIKTKVTLIFAMGACLVIYMRKVCLKIEKDITNSTSAINFMPLHVEATKIESVLELVNISYILIGLIFLINPYLRVTDVEKRKEYFTFTTISNNPNHSFLYSISLIRFRWVTAVLSTILVMGLIVTSFIVSNTYDIYSAIKFRKDVWMSYLFYNNFMYIIGILYGIFYYYFDIKKWPVKENVHLYNDDHFNIFTSSFQLIFSGGMIFLIFIIKNKIYDPVLKLIHIFYFLILAFQIIIQSRCINSAIRRNVICNHISSWKSKLYPPMTLTVINFGFMIIHIFYSRYLLMLPFVEEMESNHIVYVAIKNFVHPVTILNRLHGMAFFIHLSIQQWQE